MWEELKISGGDCTVVNLPLKQFTSCNNYVPIPSEMFSDTAPPVPAQLVAAMFTVYSSL